MSLEIARLAGRIQGRKERADPSPTAANYTAKWFRELCS